MDIFIVIINLLVCLAGGTVCICRLGRMTSATKDAVVVQYAILIIFFAMSALSFAWGEPARVVQTLMSVAILAKQLIGYGAWRAGQPAYALKGFATQRRT